MAFSAQTYIKNVIPKFEALFGHSLNATKTPMAEECHPETDDSPLCSPDDGAKFRSIIGCANWMITLGRFDIHYATMSLRRFIMAPRENHLKAAKRIFSTSRRSKRARFFLTLHIKRSQRTSWKNIATGMSSTQTPKRRSRMI